MNRLLAVVNARRGSDEAEIALTSPGIASTRYVFGRADPKEPIRFAVGRPGRRSTLWRLWANRGKNDIYVATRRSAGIFKVSLHESGDWRIQWVGDDHGDVAFDSYEAGPDLGRIMHRWTRPAPGRSGWTEALSLWVPSADLSEIPGDLEPGHDAQWLDPAPIGCATEFRIMVVEPGQGPYELTGALQDRELGLALVNGFRLIGGEVILLFAATVALDQRLVSDVDKARQRARNEIVPGFDLSPETGPRAAVIAADDNGHRNIWDLALSSR